MFPMPQYRNPVSLIPGGCPQLLDFAADLSLLDSVRYSFEEIPEAGTGGETRVHLHAFRRNSEGEFVDELDPARSVGGYGYELTGRKAILPWLGRWIPVPFLRTREQTWPGTDDCRFEYGPTNWARARLSLADDAPDSLRVVLAFDMGVEKKSGDVYAALTPADVDDNAHFRLAWRFRDNAWFMDLAWVEEWLRELWQAWRRREGRPATDEEQQFAHLAAYLTTLEALERAIRATEVYVIRPDPKNCVDVDLVLDIGNSRTTGILVETHTQSATNLNDSYLLQLRDMDEPDKVSTEPFETRVEFSEISFGNDALSLRSGRRTPAFAWPSPVRIGPEAARLATLSRCEQGSTGMSSPKRYLWDERNWKRTWRFNTKSEKAPYVTRGPLAQRINSSGTPLCCMDDPAFRGRAFREQERESAFESLFTRSSLMMFLLVEIIQQALLTINSPGQRCRREASAEPRRLRQVIFTVPGGMPIAEQRIYKRWARWAVHVLWEALGWGQYYVPNPSRRRHGEAVDYRTNPVIRCDWDEATCTQLVFIYNEITRKFQGDALLFCEIMGRPRFFPERKGEAPSVRVATIDIGGGTTDLSITTFELASDEGATPRMAPHPDFHDGFNLAGDDILRAVVAEHVLTAIGAAMSEAGVQNTRAALAALFGRDTMDSDKDQLSGRIQFVRQVAVPAALRVLSLYEQADVRGAGQGTVFRLGDCFARPAEEAAPENVRATRGARSGKDKDAPGEEAAPVFTDGLAPMPSAAALAYLTDAVARLGGSPDFDPLAIPIRVDPRRVDDTVRTALREVLANLCEVIHLYDCDVLLLTGRPSRWPGIAEIIYSMLPVPPSRIFPMGEYRVGGWYPFSDALGNMTDPKTTVVVGAILCALAEGQLEGFSFDPHGLSLSSTARYIGEMELNGQIRASKVWFTVDPARRIVEPPVAEVSFSGPLAVGFRQLAAERWTTTRYYFLEFINDDARREYAHRLPFTVKLRLELPGEDDAPGGEGEFSIEEIRDRNGEGVPNRVLDMRLQTLPRDEGFWMDTGIVYGD